MINGENYINGVWEGGNGENIFSHNPATKELIWQGNAAAAAQVDAAATAAALALPAWSAKTLEERVSIIERYRELLEIQAEEMALAIARETGKILWDARGEVQAMIGKIAISLKAYHERTGSRCMEVAGVHSGLRHKPHGVVAVYGPYNFPGHLPNGHIVPALIAGNTIVFKPSDYTPLVAEMMVKIWEEAELPAGVLNLVQGGKETGIALAAHPALNGIYFTGSAEVGALLHKQFGGRPEVMLALEMGGNNPLIIHEVEDVKAAALLAVQSAFASTGQRCTCARRLIVPHGAAGDAVIQEICTMAANLLVGAHDDMPEPFMGPLISERETYRLLEAQAALLDSGANALLRMEAREGNSAFVTPAILDVTAVSARPDKEYFGPFLQIIRVENMQAVMVEANDTRYGLAAGIITDNPALYDMFIANIHAGVVAWNRPTTGASSALPFGGVGISGNHRPSAYYAADYCAYPVASQEAEKAVIGKLPPGIVL